LKGIKNYFFKTLDKIVFKRSNIIYQEQQHTQRKKMTTLTLRYPYDWNSSSNGGDYAHYCKQVEQFIIFWSSSEMSEENTMIGYHRGKPIIVTRHDCYGSPVFEVEGLTNPSVIEDQDGEIFIDDVHFTPVQYCESAQYWTAENWARQCVHAAQALVEQNEIEAKKEELIYAA
jgi:hypothetical protein